MVTSKDNSRAFFLSCHVYNARGSNRKVDSLTTEINTNQVFIQLLQDQSVEEHYHGTTITCNITTTNKLCNDGNCGICGISSTGLALDNQNEHHLPMIRHRFYLAPNSSKCHDYIQGVYMAIEQWSSVTYPGRTNSQQLTGPPPGCVYMDKLVASWTILRLLCTILMLWRVYRKAEHLHAK